MSHESDLSASSISKNPIVMKILVDYQHYEKLLEAEKFQNKYYDKVTQSMVHKSSKLDHESSHHKKPIEAETSTSQDSDLKPNHATVDDGSSENTANQIGSGQDSKSLADSISDLKQELSDYLTAHVTNLVTDLFKQHFNQIKHSPLNEQSGKGSGDLQPLKTDTFLTFDSEPTPGTSVNDKSVDKQVTQVDIVDLLSKIPSAYHDDARKLLAYFLDNPTAISWDENGILTVDDITIPQSNIFQIFPQLYAKTPKSTLPGFVTLCTYIFTAGLQNLIKIKKFHQFTRKRPLNGELKPDEEVDLRTFSSNKRWYYIGDK